MAQEKKETAVGLQLGEHFAQLTWYYQGMKEPLTPGADTKEGPAISRIPEGTMADKDALRSFLEGMIVKVPEFPGFDTLHIMVTVRELTQEKAEKIADALESLGCPRKNIGLQDYLSSFYAYTINQKKELWNGDVALLEYRNGQMIGYVLHIDQTKTPQLVTVEEAGRQAVDESLRGDRSQEDWDKERDRLLFELLKKIFERRNVVTTYLMGDYFDGTWSVRSFQYLCHRRHAFRGGNLYTKGACYAAMERAGMTRFPDMLFLGKDIVRENIGMNMRVRGREWFYTIINAGVNWYEAHHECEFIPDGEKNITILTKPMTGGNEVEHVLRLKRFPQRPNRATRLRMTVYFTSPSECVVEVEDLGFGGFFRSSGKTWKRSIYI